MQKSYNFLSSQNFDSILVTKYVILNKIHIYPALPMHSDDESELVEDLHVLTVSLKLPVLGGPQPVNPPNLYSQ